MTIFLFIFTLKAEATGLTVKIVTGSVVCAQSCDGNCEADYIMVIGTD